MKVLVTGTRATGTKATGTILPFSAAPTGHGTLVCLRETSFSDQFHFWRGASERRYAVSVASIGAKADASAMPEFDGFVLMAVAGYGAKRWPLAIVAIERSADRRAIIVDAIASGAREWHVHLLGSDRAARAAIVADLRARHGSDRLSLSA